MFFPCDAFHYTISILKSGAKINIITIPYNRGINRTPDKRQYYVHRAPLIQILKDCLHLSLFKLVLFCHQDFFKFLCLFRIFLSYILLFRRVVNYIIELYFLAVTEFCLSPILQRSLVSIYFHPSLTIESVLFRFCWIT